MKVKIDYGKTSETIDNVDRVVHWSAVKEVGVWKDGKRTCYGETIAGIKKHIMQVNIDEDSISFIYILRSAFSLKIYAAYLTEEDAHKTALTLKCPTEIKKIRIGDL